MTYGTAHSLDVFFGMGDIARRYNISIKEVEETILRTALRKMGAAPRCKHVPKDVTVRRDGSRAHCKKCWQWMDVVKRPGNRFEGEFKLVPSKLEGDLEKTLMFTLGEVLQ
jgi:hypothetical protein